MSSYYKIFDTYVNLVEVWDTISSDEVVVRIPEVNTEVFSSFLDLSEDSYDSSCSINSVVDVCVLSWEYDAPYSSWKVKWMILLKLLNLYLG